MALQINDVDNILGPLPNTEYYNCCSYM